MAGGVVHLHAAGFGGEAEEGLRLQCFGAVGLKEHAAGLEVRDVLAHQQPARLGARHLVTRPYRPQTNGKAERFIKTLLAEWAYVRLYLSNPARLQTLPAWVAAYNQHRPHTALDGSPPMRVLVKQARGNHS